MMTINYLQRKAHEQATASGWNERDIPIPEMIALIHSEASEALECFRHHEPHWHLAADGKPEGLASEFADILIRIGHYADLLDINLEYCVEQKLAYNATRPHRHGGKAV